MKSFREIGNRGRRERLRFFFLYGDVDAEMLDE